MGKASLEIPALVGGEWWEGYDARSDLEAYSVACWRLQNFNPLIQGPGEKRAGTRFVAEVKDSSARTWLVPFRRSRSVSYIIEFGDLYCRFYFNRALLLTGSAATITGATQADPVVVTTSGAHGYSNGQDVFISGVAGMTELNDRFFRVANVTSTTFELQDMFSADVDGTGFTAYSSGGEVDKPYEIVSPYNTAALELDNGEFGLEFTQSNDVLYITDRRGDLKPRLLSRTGSTSWAFSTLDPDDGPYLQENDDETIAMHASAASGTGVTIQASEHDVFKAGHVGALVRLDQENITKIDPWEAAQSVSAGDYRRSEGHEYQAVNSGTTGEVIPSHTTGIVTDDTVDWEYITSGFGVGRITAVTVEGDQATVDVLTTFPQSAVLSTSDLSGSAVTITGITQANPGVVTTSGAHGFSDGDVIYITGAVGMAEVNTRWYKINNASGTTFELQNILGVDVDTTNYTAYTSGGTVDEIGVSNYENTHTTLWRFGAWSDDNGYPEVVSFFLDRIAFGQQGNVYYSVGRKFDSFAPDEKGEVDDTSAITIELNSDQINTITAMVAGRAEHLIFTEGAEWAVSRLQDSGVFGPTNTEASEQTAYGTRPLRVIRVGESVLYVTSTGRKMRELRYSIESDSLRSNEMTIRANHILRDGAAQIDWQNEPFKSLLIVRQDGELVQFVFDRDQDAFAWARMVFGGNFGGGKAVCESVAVISAIDNTRDDYFTVIKRTINGVTKRYVEYGAEEYWDGDDVEDAVYVDSSLEYDGASTSSVSGLWHLEGESVNVLADGAVQPAATVSGGEIAISPGASKVQAGLSYDALYASMRLQGGARDGTSQAKLVKIPHVHFRVYNTRGGQSGLDENNLTDVPGLNDRAPSTPMGQASPLVTGDVQFRPNDRQIREPRIWFKHSQPLPCTLLGVYPSVRVQDNNN